MAKNITTMRKAHKAKEITWAPYNPLDAVAERYFYDLLTCRASFDWSRADVIALTRVASWLARADEYNARLEMEGLTVTNAKGTEVVNPMFYIASQLEQRIVSVMVKLAIFSVSSTSAGNKIVAGERAKAANQVTNDDQDDLIG